MSELLKINNQREILFNSLVTRANSELLLILHADSLAQINGTTKEIEYNKLLEQRQEIINQLIDESTKYV